RVGWRMRAAGSAARSGSCAPRSSGCASALPASKPGSRAARAEPRRTGPAPDTSSPGVVDSAPMRSRNWLALGAVAHGVSSGATALAQDANYWSTAYGTRAQLLGGVVTGSSGDISSVYYNPGALALSPNAEFLLAGYALQYQRVSVANGSGPRRDLVSSVITTVPSLIAGELPVLKHDRLAYSYLSRQQVD